MERASSLPSLAQTRSVVDAAALASTHGDLAALGCVPDLATSVKGTAALAAQVERFTKLCALTEAAITRARAQAALVAETKDFEVQRIAAAAEELQALRADCDDAKRHIQAERLRRRALLAHTLEAEREAVRNLRTHRASLDSDLAAQAAELELLEAQRSLLTAADGPTTPGAFSDASTEALPAGAPPPSLPVECRTGPGSSPAAAAVAASDEALFATLTATGGDAAATVEALLATHASIPARDRSTHRDPARPPPVEVYLAPVPQQQGKVGGPGGGELQQYLAPGGAVTDGREVRRLLTRWSRERRAQHLQRRLRRTAGLDKDRLPPLPKR